MWLIFFQEANIENGFIRVNRKVAHQTFKLKYGQRITFIWHNHETPVIALPPKILFQDENVIVIDKPPGIPVRIRDWKTFKSLTDDFNLF